MSESPRTMQELLDAVRARLDREGHGARVALARRVEVSAVTVDRWLSDPPKRYPDGERTLAILEWLESAEH